MADQPREIRRRVPFPFEGDEFPADLGAVVQVTVLDGSEPARVVGHTDEGAWYVGDGVHDPNAPGAVVATHLWHVVERNSSLRRLATLAPGQRAERVGPGSPWVVVEDLLEP